MDYDTVVRSKRKVIRSIKKQRDTVLGSFAQTPSETLVQTIQSHLDQWAADLNQLSEYDEHLLKLADYSKCKNAADIEKLEVDVTAEHSAYKHDFCSQRGKLNAMRAKLDNETRKSLSFDRSASFADSTPSPLSKLPDLKVPNFDGKLHSYTNWQAIFTAVVHNNESLSDIHKLYYLKNALVGDAKDLLADFPLNDKAYEPAFAHVKQRYFNKRAIIAENFRQLVDYPKIESTKLRRSIDQLQAIERGLKACDIDTARMSPLIAFLVARKLPDDVRRDWEKSVTDYSTYPSFDPLITFLSNQCFAYETISTDSEPSKSPTTERRSKRTPSSTASPKDASKANFLAKQTTPPAGTPYTPKCFDCSGEHTLFRCPNFDRKPVSERYDFVNKHRLCRNCLRPNHSAERCNSNGCRQCGAKHSTKLHRDSPDVTPAAAASGSSAEPVVKSSMSIARPKAAKFTTTLLPCAVVRVKLATDRYVLARALIDGCSQAHLVTESFVRRHRLLSNPASSTIAGVGPSVSSSQAVELTIGSQFSDYTLTFAADVIGRLPYDVTAGSLCAIAKLNSKLQIADSGLQSTQADILIGTEYANRILSGQKRFIGETCFENSPLGWIVSGPIDRRFEVSPKCCCLSVNIEDALTQFWEVEHVDAPRKSESEFELIEAHFEATHTRLADGRFEVRLPFRATTNNLANTHAQARAALLRNERDLSSPVRAQYIEFMREYRELGHMRLVDKAEEPFERYYIPHLPVLRPDSSTTKLRVVFNASAKNSSGVSLNENLLNGDELQPPLFDTLLNHRKYPIAFSADISKMYRQIAMNSVDCKWQSILWRDNPTDPMRTWELTTLTYGTRPASFIAKKCLQKIADDHRSTEPEIAEAIENEFLMDDLMTGAATVEAAIEKQQKIHSALLRSKFPLRKYVSNSIKFTQALDPALVENLRTVEFSSTGVARILGLIWCPADDVFRVSAKVVDTTHTVITKRVVSSLVASVYDPLGLVAPVLIRGKILLQALWREELDWDSPVSTKLAAEFTAYYRELGNLVNVQIPRAYPTDRFEIFGFCDASVQAYGAVLYARSSTAITIICSKSKVAPSKPLTIPRLELLGATLLTGLVKRVSSILKLTPSTCKLYCDSTVALAWIRGPASKYETFVRNRIDYISSIIPIENWSYVRSAENPADLLTHGITPIELAQSSLWLRGPTWLQTLEPPIADIQLPNDPPEQRRSKVTLTTTTTISEDRISSYSSFDHLLRITKLSITFTNRLRKLPDCTNRQAAYSVYRMSQATWFSEELECLLDKQPVPPKSHLHSLEPFVDQSGVLRSGGRLSNADLPFDTKHPVIIHCKSKLAKLLVKHVHEAYAHATNSFIVAYLQRRYYFIHGIAKLVKSVLKCCVYCTRMKAQTMTQIMGDLPSERTRIARPFTNCGVDFAGPFTIRCTNHRSPKHLKYYAAFFVCLVTRAVHIESVADLSTEAFMAALHRFVARRGVPATMWSDNATNFVGARNAILKVPSTLDISWKFIPPRSPHHGGIWEAAVKAGKRHLLAVSKGAILTEDAFKTTLTSIEAIMNSRPLYRRRTSDVYDVVDVITPGHFLVQGELLTPDAPPPPDFSLLGTFDAKNRMVAQFWATWRKFYLTSLHRKPKWTASQPNIVSNDIVLLKEQSSPLHWPLARVIEVLPDRKGRARIARLRAKGSEFTRSIQQLVRLPVEN